MRDYESYRGARNDFNQAWTNYHVERLERELKIVGVKAETQKQLSDLAELRAKAQSAADRGSSGFSLAIASTFDRAKIDDALGKVSAMGYTYNKGMFEKMALKSAGRAAAAYLADALHHFDAEKKRIEDKGKAALDPFIRASLASDSEIRSRAIQFSDEVTAFTESVGASALPFDHPSWQETTWKNGEGVIRLAPSYRLLGSQKLEVPALARVPGHNVMIYKFYMPDTSRRELTNTILLRALRSVRPGRVRLLLIDPASLGEIYAPILSVSQHSEEIITTRVWTSESEIRQRLEEESDRVGLIIQKYLTDEYETLDDYNRAAGEVAEESVVIAINDFPRGLDQRSIEIVRSLANVGPRAGVSLLLVQATEMPQAEHWQMCIDIANTGCAFGGYTVKDKFQSTGSYSTSTIRPSSVTEQVKEFGTNMDLFRFDSSTMSWQDERYDWITWSGKAGAPEKWVSATADMVLESVGKRYGAGSRVEVKLDKVWALFAAGRGGRSVSIDDPDSLWLEESRERLVIPVGRHGSRGVTTFDFDSQLQSSAILIGRPGSGKSNLLHVIISTLAAMYSPSELELYLLDFKEAVEFNGYADPVLPHARAIALEADREFGLAVLQHLSAEIELRGRVFRDSAGSQTNIVTYRAQGGTMPRVLLLIDEFHRLFDRDDAIANEAAKHLDDIIRLGRGFGIHALLASQTILGMNAIGRHTLNQIATRAALHCTEEDSRLVFSDENPAGSLLTRPGEAIKNTGGGRVANNEPFQVPLLPESERRVLLDTLHARAQREGTPVKSRVYRRDTQARWSAPERDSGSGVPNLRFGDAVAIEPSFGYPLARESGRNILVVGRNESLAGEMLAACIAGLSVERRDGVHISVIDLMSVDGPVSTTANNVGAKLIRRRDFVPFIVDLAESIDGDDGTTSSAIHLVVFNGLAKARDLDPDDYSDEGQLLGKSLATVLRDGPDMGVHTVVWADALATVDRRLGRLEREFGARVVFRMTADDSLRLCDSEIATGLREREAVLVDLDRGSTTKFQPFAAPDAAL